MINQILSRSKQSVLPEIGMGVTVLFYTDRKAGTIVEVSKSGKTFKFRFDLSKRVDNNGMSDSQEYEFKPNPEGKVFTAYLTRKGQWKVRKSGNVLLLGTRQEYYDFSF